MLDQSALEINISSVQHETLLLEMLHNFWQSSFTRKFQIIESGILIGVESLNFQVLIERARKRKESDEDW